MTEEDILKDIEEESKWIDIKPFSHNIVTFGLRVLSEKFGWDDDRIRQVVLSNHLDQKGWGYLVNGYKEEK
jgi:hypothetical protein